MHNTEAANREFEITFCETNIRWLLGELETPERDIKISKMQNRIIELTNIESRYYECRNQY